jgi:hypothetical protein
VLLQSSAIITHIVLSLIVAHMYATYHHKMHPAAAAALQDVVCCALWTIPAEVCRQPLPAGWQFHSYKDSSGSDIGQVVNTNGNWTQLAAACESSPWCMAVNTNGWMKSTLLPQAQWSNSFSDVCSGLLTKGRHKQPLE